MASSDGVGKVYVSHEELLDLMRDAAPQLKGSHVAIGPITATADGFEVDYAYSDECHPKDWIHPPWWMPQPKAVK
jgi:hypothetical protein